MHEEEAGDSGSMMRSELPSYGRAGSSSGAGLSSRQRQAHTYTLQNGNKPPWATLHVLSWAPTAKSLPVFFEGQTIEGSVDLDLPKPENIKAITISVSSFSGTYVHGGS